LFDDKGASKLTAEPVLSTAEPEAAAGSTPGDGEGANVSSGMPPGR
jgi:hypothetical protein